jgi:polyisoprenyl-phosphate glycosyltransferase
MIDTMVLSIVSPVYQAENIVDALVLRITQEVEKITPSYEIILVEDGSRDESWNKIELNCQRNRKVKGIKLSRNFGQHYAISAGLGNASGQWVVVMDCDLQDNPKYIKDLYEKAQEGYDIVYTAKTKRQHSFFKDIIANAYFFIFNYLSDQKQDDKTGAYSIISRKVVDAFCQIKDFHRHYLPILQLVGFKSTIINIEHEKRFEGKSSYNFLKLLKLATHGIVSQSDKLLRVSISIGFILFILSFLWAGYIIVMYFVRGAQPGYTSIMAMLLLSTGLILMSIGIAGIYIGKIFEQVKGRPLYFVDKKVNI